MLTLAQSILFVHNIFERVIERDAYLGKIMDNVPNIVSWTIEKDDYLGTIMDNLPNTWTYKHKPQTIRIHKEFRFL